MAATIIPELGQLNKINKMAIKMRNNTKTSVPPPPPPISKGQNKSDKDRFINSIMDAVTASGKKFEDIGRDSFYKFFESQKIPTDMWDSTYLNLCELYKPKKSTSSGVIDDTMKKIMDSPPVDYYSKSQNDVKSRTPRKNIFGKISKIS